jgi:hypothetical protein
MPQPLNLSGGGSGTLLVRRQTRTLLHVCPSGVVLEVEEVLHVPGQRSNPNVEVRPSRLDTASRRYCHTEFC